MDKVFEASYTIAKLVIEEICKLVPDDQTKEVNRKVPIDIAHIILKYD